MRALALYDGEEVKVEFSARVGVSDYGVKGSPTFYEFSGIEVSQVTILGVDIDFKVLPDNLKIEIMRLSDEVEFTVE